MRSGPAQPGLARRNKLAAVLPSAPLIYCPNSRLMPGLAGLGPGYPGLGWERAARAWKKSGLAAAWARVGAMAAMWTYQEKYRSRYFVATPRKGLSQ